MKNFVSLGLCALVGYLGFMLYQSKTTEEALREQLIVLRAQDALENTRLSKLKNESAQSTASAKAERSAKLASMRGRLQLLTEQREKLTRNLSDVSQSGGIRSLDEQIKTKNIALQQLNADLAYERDRKKNIDRDSAQNKQLQKLEQERLLYENNEHIRVQQEQVNALRNQIAVARRTHDVNRPQQIQELESKIKEQEQLLGQLRSERVLINQRFGAQSLQNQYQVNTTKDELKRSESEIEATIGTLKADIKRLEGLRGNSQGTVQELKKQVGDLDLQIKDVKTLIQSWE